MTSTNTLHPSLSLNAFRPPIDDPVDKTTLPFDPLTLPARHLKEQNWNSYRIYKNDTEFVTIEGQAAYDAIAKSGIVKPVRVVRTMKEINNDVLTNADLLEQTEVTAPPVKEIPKNGIIEPPAPGSVPASAEPTAAAEPAAPAPDAPPSDTPAA